jgi:hypothetical protein
MAVGISTSEPVGAVPGPAALTARLMSAWQEGSLEGLREIIHPDAVFETTTHRRDGVVQGREAILASLMDYAIRATRFALNASRKHRRRAESSTRSRGCPLTTRAVSPKALSPGKSRSVTDSFGGRLSTSTPAVTTCVQL